LVTPNGGLSNGVTTRGASSGPAKLAPRYPRLSRSQDSKVITCYIPTDSVRLSIPSLEPPPSFLNDAWSIQRIGVVGLAASPMIGEPRRREHGIPDCLPAAPATAALPFFLPDLVHQYSIRVSLCRR